MTGRVCAGERKGVLGDVAGGNGCHRVLDRQAQGNDSAARADIKDPRIRNRSLALNQFHELFGFWSRDKRPCVAGKNRAEKVDCSEEVLKRSPLCALAHELSKRRPFRLAKRAFEIEVELDPFLLSEDVSQEVFGIEAWALDSLLFEKTGGGIEDFKNSHEGRAIMPFRLPGGVVRYRLSGALRPWPRYHPQGIDRDCREKA